MGKDYILFVNQCRLDESWIVGVCQLFMNGSL
jgi:hypothetical protein